MLFLNFSYAHNFLIFGSYSCNSLSWYGVALCQFKHKGKCPWLAVNDLLAIMSMSYVFVARLAGIEFKLRSLSCLPHHFVKPLFLYAVAPFPLPLWFLAPSPCLSWYTVPQIADQLIFMMTLCIIERAGFFLWCQSFEYWKTWPDVRHDLVPKPV